MTVPRVVPNINIPMLLSKWRLLIIKTRTPLFSCVLTKLRERSLPLCSCDFLRGITEAAASSAPNWCSYSLRGLPWLIVCYVGWFFESVVGWILDSSCRLKTVVGFEFYLSGCTSYRCSKLSDYSLASYQDQDPTSWRSGPRTSSPFLIV
jgi:hypothetical protein